MIKLDPNGVALWAVPYGADGIAIGSGGLPVGPASMSNQPLVMVGSFTGTNAAFGSHTFNLAGLSDGFVWRTSGP